MVIEPGFLLLMHLVPVLAGAVAAIPSALISIVSRWALTWNASGVLLFPSNESVEEEQDEPLQRDADEYLRQLVRPR